MKLIHSILLGAACLCTAACSNSVDFGEQYKKVVYIVNSNDKVVSSSHMIDEETRGNIAVYCAGSEFPDHDVVVHYKIDPEAIQAFNKLEYGEATSRYLTCIPEEAVTFDSDEIVIKQGQPTGLLYFTINTTMLDPSLNNTLPLTITDASGYEINPDLQTIFYVLRLETEYSGTYASTVQYMSGGEPSATYQVTKNVQAAGLTKLKVPAGTNISVQEGENANYFTLEWNEATNKVTMTSDASVGANPWPSDTAWLGGKDTPVNYYDPENKCFVLYYGFGGHWNYEVLTKK